MFSLALLLTMFAAGCGGGTKDSGTTRVPTDHTGSLSSKAAYIELADTICSNHRSRREDLESEAINLGPLTSRAKAYQIAALLRKEGANRRAEVGELRSLQPPAADVTTVDSILSLVDGEAGVIDRWAMAYDNLDAAEIRRQQIRLGLTAGRAADRAGAYGFAVCGQQ